MVDVIDDSEQVFINFSEIPEKKFPYWILLGIIPIGLIIYILKKKK